MGIVSSRPYGRELIFTSGLDEKDAINTKTYLLSMQTNVWREGPDFPKDNSLTFDRVDYGICYSSYFANNSLILADNDSLC